MSDASLALTRPATDLKLFATDGPSMKQSQEGLILWCQAKIEEAKIEFQDAREVSDRALHAGFKVDAHKRVTSRAEKRVRMFEKMLVAFQAGYMLVPNMDCDVFAIRTDREMPRPKEAKHSSWIPPELMGTLPTGEGRYVSPNQMVYKTTDRVSDGNGGTKEVANWHTDGFQDSIDFPAIIAHPEVMTAAQKAMSLKIFDGIGVCPPNRRKGDPLLLGMIRKPNSSSSRSNSTVERVTFLIAWYVDTKTI